MAEFEAIGKALQIPQSVLNNIDAIDKKINLIASDSEKMATHFMSAMTRMGTGADGLLKKLQSIQGVINGLGSVNIGGLGNVGKGMGNTATQAEKAAASISEAASALNRFVQTWKGSGRVTSMLDSLATREQVNLLRELNNQAMQTSRTLTQMNRENSLEARKKANETKIASQEETNATNRKMEALKRENAQTKINTAEYRNYVSALTMSESSENSRLKKIERMNTVLSELQRKEALYSNEIEITRKKIEQLTRENESLARVRDKANKQRTDERTNTQALNAYNRAMAASEALVTQRINKIAKLRQAEEMLKSASGNYATQLNRINQEIARLNRLNEGQVDSYGRVIRSQRNLVNTSQQLTRQLALLFSVSQIEGYISKLVQVRGEFELQQVALTSILQNKDQADQLFAQITELAVRSPFTIKELTTYTKSLAAYQVQYEDLYDTTKMLADVSAGLGVDMQRLILAFGQVKAANFLRGTETRQFTEAGINMLGELSKYYTELEGRIVSVQEVQDRQFKRMISFQDVEEVFKRLTSAGGMFYNMQERQAETLAGQMSNLRDQFDLMFNEIGKDNQGAINTSISVIKLLIENWEIFANMLKAAAVGWATYTTTTLIAAAANGKFAASAVAATTSTKGLVGITAKLITSMKAFATFLKTNPITIIATALASAIYFWNDHRKAVEENRKAYDPLVNSVNRTITAVDELTKKIGEQNDRIKTANDNVGQYEKGTSEYARAEANANDEREKQNKLLEELKTKYPEIYNGIIRQKDGTVDYTNALKEFNGQLEQQNYLNYLARQTATSDDNGFLKNASKAAEAQQNLKIATEDANNAFILMQGRIREYFATNKYASDDLRKQLEEVGNSSLSSADKIYRMFTIITSAHGVNIGDLRDIAWDFVDVAREATKAEKELQSANEDLSEDINQISTDYKNAYDTTSEEGKRTAQSLLEQFLRNVGIQNQAVLDFVKQQFEVTIGVKLDLSNNVQQELGEVEKRVNDYLDEHQFNLVGRIDIGENFEKYMSELNDSLSSWQKELNELESATGERVAGGTNKQRIDELKTSIAQATETLKYWGKYQTQTTGGGSSKNPELDKLKEQIRLIEKAAKEYQDYRNTFDESTAQQKTENAFRQAFENLGLDVSMNFDASGVIEALRNLFNTAGDEGNQILTEKIATRQTDVETEQRTKEVEEYRKQIDELFASLSNYQELEKLGLNKDLISQLFGINVSSINDVQDIFEKIKTELQKYGNEGEKTIAEAEKKITDAQQKELKDRIAQYEEFMRNSISERARIEIEAQKEIAKIQATQGMTQPMKDASIQNVRKQADIKISKLDWQDFQNSDVYTQLFQDLEYVSTSALKRIKENLDALKDSMSNLTPEQLKSINEYYSRLEEQLSTRNPFAAMRDSLKEIRELQSEGRTEEVINQELLNYEAQAELYKTQISDLEKIIGMKQEGMSLDSLSDDLLQRNADILSLSTDELRLQLSIRKGQLNQVQTNIGISSKDLKSYSKARKDLVGLSNEIDTIRQLGKTAFGSISGILDSMGVDVDSTASTMAEMGASLVDLVAQAALFGVQLQLNTALAQVMGTAINAALGPIGWAVIALQALTSIFTAFSKIHDNKREQQIEKEQEAVDYLEKSYEKLYDTIENGLSIYSYSDNAKLIENLRKQVESYQRMIAAEQDKKKTDEDRIKDWENNIDDIYSQIDELYNNIKENLVGSFKDVSSQLASALVGAFESGEDAAEAWGNTVRDIMVDILTNIFTMKYIEPAVQEIMDNMFEQAMPKTAYATNVKDELKKAREDLSELEANKPEFSGILGKDEEKILREYEKRREDLINKIKKLESEYDKANQAAEGEIPNITEELVDSTAGELNDLRESFVDNPIADLIKQLYGQAGAGGDTLTGLQRGIESITHEQSDALQALLESLRFFVSDENAVIHNIYNTLVMPTEENPFLSELRVQSEQLRLLYGLWNGVIKNVSGSGRAVNVRIV